MNQNIFDRLRLSNRRLPAGYLRPGRGSHRSPRAMARARRADWRRRRAMRSLVRTAGSIGKTKRFLAARFRWIALVALAVVAGAGFLSWSRTPTYHAAAEVLVQSSILTNSTAELPDMGSEKAVATSGVVVAKAASALHVPAHDLAGGVSVSVPLDTHILRIGYTSTDPVIAEQRAQALAAAYVSNWKSRQTSLPQTSSKIRLDTPVTSVITPATRPSAPSSPNHVVDLGVAVIVGLALGFGTALGRDRLDDGLRSPTDLANRVGAPLIAMLPAVRYRGSSASMPLTMIQAPESRAADAYRELRTQVMRAATHRGAKTLLVTCPSTEAKTVVSANLAVGLAQAGYRVTFVCADLRHAYGDRLLGAYDGTNTPRLHARADLTQVLRDTPVEGLRVLPSEALDNDHGTIPQTPMLRRALDNLRTGADFVIIDSPPVLLGADAGAIAELVEMILVVADARRSTRRQIDATAHRLEHVRANVIGCVLDNLGRRVRVHAAPPTLPPISNGADLARRVDGALADVHTVTSVGGGENR